MNVIFIAQFGSLILRFICLFKCGIWKLMFCVNAMPLPASGRDPKWHPHPSPLGWDGQKGAIQNLENALFCDFGDHFLGLGK